MEQKELHPSKTNPALTTQSTAATSNTTNANTNATVATADTAPENSNPVPANTSAASANVTDAESGDSESFSDDDGEASDFNENEEPWPDSFDFDATPTSKMYIRHPSSLEPWTAQYNQQIRGPLTTFLTNNLSSFYMTLVVLCEKPPDNTPPTEVPMVVIIFDSEKDSNIPMNIPTIPDIFVVALCHGEYTYLVDIIFPMEQKYQKNPTSGVSICAKEIGTVGIYMTKKHEKFYGVSCAHILGSTASQRLVQQPSPGDFVRHVKVVEHGINNLERLITSTTHEITRYTFNEEIKELKEEHTVLQSLNNPVESELKKNLLFGRVQNSEFAMIQYKGRKCLADWGVFEVDAQRPPSLTPASTSGPMEGVLADTSWNRAEGFGPLKFDDVVRKTGRTTGTTYGFIGGTYSSFKPGNRFGEQVSEEYWVIQDNSVSSNAFANPGDSGSAVVNSLGYIVGFVFAHVEIAALKIIIDPKSHMPDIPKIKERRQADGSVDVEGLVSVNLVGTKFILIESAEMVMERWHKPEMELVMNC